MAANTNLTLEELEIVEAFSAMKRAIRIWEKIGTEPHDLTGPVLEMLDWTVFQAANQLAHRGVYTREGDRGLRVHSNVAVAILAQWDTEREAKQTIPGRIER